MLSFLTSCSRQNHILYYLHNNTSKDHDGDQVIHSPRSQCKEPIAAKTDKSLFQLEDCTFFQKLGLLSATETKNTFNNDFTCQKHPQRDHMKVT